MVEPVRPLNLGRPILMALRRFETPARAWAATKISVQQHKIGDPSVIRITQLWVGLAGRGRCRGDKPVLHSPRFLGIALSPSGRSRAPGAHLDLSLRQIGYFAAFLAISLCSASASAGRWVLR